MNPHYHPYGGPELTSPHPPSPDNNYHGHGHHPGGPLAHARIMHPANGHTMGALAHHELHTHHNHLHAHHPAFGGGPPPPDGAHHLHNTPSSITTTSNTATGGSNRNNGGGGGGSSGCGTTVKICAGCGGKILERFLLHALDRYWHNSCLKCSCCGAMLADIGSSCFTRSEMILCKQDYTRLFGNSGACSACGQMIPASEFVMRTGGPSPQQPGAPLHVFHLKCFACSKCGAPLVQGDRYYMLAGSLVCEQDWHKLLKTSTSTPAIRKGKVGRPRRSRD